MLQQDFQTFRFYLEKLRNEEETRQHTLTEIKNMLSVKPAQEAATVIKDAGLSGILQCLYSRDTSRIDLTCQVLKVCFEKFEVGEVIKNFVPYMMYLLRHEKSCVRQLAIDQVYNAVSSNPNLLPCPEYIDVFIAAAQMVGDDDIGVANKAIKITSNLPESAYPRILDEMKIALQYNSSAKCNAFEVVINISTKSNEMFTLCAEHGYIEFMISELTSMDILYQLNILELLSRLAVKPHGITFLIRNGALQKIVQLVDDVKDQPLGNLIVPGYLKFFGAVAHHYPREIFNKYPQLLDVLFETFDNNDQTVLPVALDTLGFMGTTIEGKLCLAALGRKYTKSIEDVSALIRNSSTELKVRALYCLACLISVENEPNTSGPVDPRVTLMTREWFRTLHSNPMQKLFEICKIPFPDIRSAAFTLLDAVCQHNWGEEFVATTPAFIEYLLDRGTNYTKETKEIKFNVIRRLSRSMVFDANTLQRLVNYIEQGPFFDEGNLEVAMEGED